MTTAERVRGVIERLVHDGTAVARADGSVHSLFPVAASAAEGAALRDRVVGDGATRTIEVGLGYGISALFVCEGLLTNRGANARHVAIDPHQATRFADCGLQFLEEAGVADMVDHHAEDSQIVLPRFLGEGRRFDLALSTGTTVSTASSSTSPTWGGSSTPAGSCSSTTTSCRRSPGRRRTS